MKTGTFAPSVGRVLDLLRRSRLLGAPEAVAVQERWRAEAARPDDVSAFCRWLIEQDHVSELQMALLLHDHPEHFYFGPYRFLAWLSRSRQSTVYRAEGREGEVVAVKVLPPARARDPRLLARFQTEAALTTAFDHPHLVRGLGAGSECGLHYLVLEHLEGETLRRRLHTRGRLSARTAAEVVRQALLGVGHLHARGVVHRNLEPGNLMLRRSSGERGEQITVKVLDLSLARDTNERPGSHLLGRGDDALALAAPGYRAPEAAHGFSSLDGRADVYSLGCVLYHALTGQAPRPDGPPSVRQAVPDVPDELARIVDRMMAPTPDLRFPDPDQAAAALQQFIQGGQTAAPGEGRMAVVVARETDPEEGEFAEASVELVLPPLPAPEESELAVPPAVFEEPAPPEDSIVSPDAGRVPRGRFTRRDYLLLFLGGLGVLIAQGAGWVVAQLVNVSQAGR